jgi:ankyrin repeat protein
MQEKNALLLKAAQRGDKDGVALLLEMGADIDAKDKVTP